MPHARNSKRLSVKIKKVDEPGRLLGAVVGGPDEIRERVLHSNVLPSAPLNAGTRTRASCSHLAIATRLFLLEANFRPCHTPLGQHVNQGKIMGYWYLPMLEVKRAV